MSSVAIAGSSSRTSFFATTLYTYTHYSALYPAAKKFSQKHYYNNHYA